MRPLFVLVLVVVVVTLLVATIASSARGAGARVLFAGSFLV
jgi:hypothetical protein